MTLRQYLGNLASINYWAIIFRIIFILVVKIFSQSYFNLFACFADESFIY